MDPLSYREVLARVIERRRPGATVEAVASHELDEAVAGCAPRLVVCDRITPRVVATAHSWVHVVRPELRDAVVCVGLDHHARVKDVGIGDLLAVVDSARGSFSGAPRR